MAGYNIYLLSPRKQTGRYFCKVYARYRPNDDEPGTETDLGVPAREVELGATVRENAQGPAATSIKAVLSVMYPALSFTDTDILDGPKLTCGIKGLLFGKEWRRLNP